MPTYIIAYDVKDATKRAKLREELAKYKTEHIQDSVWTGDFNNTAKELRKHLRAFIGPLDPIIVAEYDEGNTASANNVNGRDIGV